MSLAAIVDAMADAGCTPHQIAAAVRAHEEKMRAAQEKKRADTAERQRRFRERNASNALQRVTPVTVDGAKESSPHTPLKENPLPKENPPKGGQKKGVRLPDDWQPTTDDRGYGGRLGFSASEIEAMAEDLRLWASAASGNVAVKRDWSSAFKGWMRREQRKRPQRANVLPFGSGSDPPARPKQFSDEEGRRRALEFQRMQNGGRA